MQKVTGLLLLILIPLLAVAEPHLATAEAATQLQVLTGFTRARTNLTLSSEESGRVEQVFADVGEPVPADGHLVCLDDTFLKLDQQVNLSEQARIKVDIVFFRKQVKRYKSLVKSNSSAQIQLEESQRNLESTIQQLEGLKIRYQVMEERLERHCVQAPAGLLLIERLVEPGQWVSKGQQVARVGDFSQLLIPFALTPTEFQALQQIENLHVFLPDSGNNLRARIERVSPAFDEVSRKISVELEVSDGLDARRGGLRAELKLDLPFSSGAVVLPESAISERYEQYWLKREDGSEVKVVYLGRDRKNRVRVISPEVIPGQHFQITGG